MPSRRSVPRALGAGSVSLSGCTDLSSSQERVRHLDADATSATTGRTATETTSETGPSAPVCDTPWIGDALWTVDEATNVGDPAAAADRVFVSAESGLLGLKSADGTVDWRYPGVDSVYAVADDAGVFLTLDGGGLFALDRDRTVRWRREDDDWYYHLDLADGVVLQPTSDAVVAIDVRSGETRWRDDRTEMHAASADGTVYGAGGGNSPGNGVLTALDAATGKQRWETEIRGCGYRLTIGSETVALPVGCRNGPGHTALFDAATGCRYGALERRAALDAGDGRLSGSFDDAQGRIAAFDLPGGG